MIKVGILGSTGRVGSLLIDDLSNDSEARVAAVHVFDKLVKNLPTDTIVTNDMKVLFDESDVIIDFSSEESIKIYGEVAAENGIKIVSAVSHYSEETIEYIKKLSEKTVTFWSPNITLGVNYILVISKFMKKIAPNIDIQIVEEHFKGKNEISGTAKVLASNLDVDNNEIKSIRAGGIVGKHEIIFGFPFQTVRLTHESISREAFGNGVIFVVKNIIDKEKGFYKEEGLDVRIHAGDPDHQPVPEVLAGHTQYAESNSEVLYQRLLGKPLVPLPQYFSTHHRYY